MTTTINSTITLGGTAQWQAALNASSRIVITNNAPGEQLIVASNGAPAGPLNGVIIYTSLTIDNAGNNPGLFPEFSNGSISLYGRNTGQSFTITYS